MGKCSEFACHACFRCEKLRGSVFKMCVYGEKQIKMCVYGEGFGIRLSDACFRCED